MSYYEKYLKYKRKYNVLKQHNQNYLPLELNNLFDDIQQNDLYKQIYNKFYYLPIKNNIQIILKYYPSDSCDNKDSCMIKYKDNFSSVYDIVEKDTHGNEYYYRKHTHLHSMLTDDYIDYITIDSNKIYNKNIIPKIEWDGMGYVICPTIDPVHSNHLLLINKQNIRAHQFYFPTDHINILNDMCEYNKLTGYYVYNSIELGSIPEIVHFHTSNETPPLDNITNINKYNLPLYSTDYIKLYKINLNCYNGYYIEVSNDFINEFIKILPKLLYNSRYVDGYKYMGQVFICPYKYNFFRIVITFRKVDQSLTKPINGYYTEQYYNQLFGDKYPLCYGKTIGYTNTLRFNILGYEPVIINYDPYEKTFNQIKTSIETNNYSIVNACLDKTSEYLKNYCKKVFTFNKTFEEFFTIEFNKKHWKTSQPLYDNFILQRTIHNIENINISNYNNLFITENTIETITSNTIYNYTSLIKHVLIKGKSYQSIHLNNYDDFINHIHTYKTLLNINKLFTVKMFSISKNTVYYKHIQKELNIFLDEEETKYGYLTKKNYSNVFFLMLLYQVYTLFQNGFVFENINPSNIFVCGDLLKKYHIKLELDFRSDKIIIINYKDGLYNFYGYKPIIFNVGIKKSNNPSDIIKSIIQLDNIFTHSDIKNNLDKKELNYTNLIFKFIDSIQKDYVLNPIKISHELIVKINKDKLVNYEPTYTFLYNKILEKSSELLSVINNYNTITIPKHTRFTCARSNDLEDVHNMIKNMGENTWNYQFKKPTWFVSNYDLDNKIGSDDYLNVKYKKLDGSNSDYYIKAMPHKLSRHLIFKNNKDIKLLITEFNGIKRLEFHKKIWSIIYSNIFDSIDPTDINEYNKYNLYTPDSYVTFSMSVLKENNLLDIDGYIGMDWIDKFVDCAKTSSGIEYLLLNPICLDLIGLYYYDYYTNDFKLFLSSNKWNNFIIDRIMKFNIGTDNLNKIKTCSGHDLIQEKFNTIYDYSLISTQYIKYLNLIMEDEYIIDNNNIDDFEDSNNKTISYTIE
jgi:hypothetical protein